MPCCSNSVAARLARRTRFLAALTLGSLVFAWQVGAAGLSMHPSLKMASEAAALDQSLVLLIFGAEWCSPCKLLKSAIDSDDFQQKAGVLQVVMVDTDGDEETARTFSVEALPDLVLLTADGKIVSRQAGFSGASNLLAWIDAGRAKARVGKWEGIAPGRDLEEFAAKAAGSGLKPEDIQQLILVLGRPDPAERAAAAKLLLNAGEPVVLPLIEAAGDPYLGIRIEASELLRRLVQDRNPIDPWMSPSELTNVLAGWRTWWAATGKLSAPKIVEQPDALPAASVQNSIAALKSDDPVARTSAMASLVARGTAALPPIRDAIRKAESAGDHRSIAFLEDMRWAILVSDSVERRVEGARRILARGKGPERQAIAAKLGRVGRDAFPALTELVNDGDSLVVEAAVRGLSSIGGKDAVPAMAGLLAADNSNLRMTAAQALGKSRNPDAVKPLLAVFDDADEIVACTALAAVEQIRSSKKSSSPDEAAELSEALKQSLSDPRWRVRAAAVEVVGKLGLRDLSDAVKLLLQDPDGFVVRNSLVALDKLNANPSVQELAAVVRRLPALRFEIVQAVLQQQGDDAVKTVTEIFREASPDQQTAILHLLAQREMTEEPDGTGWKPLLNQAATSGEVRLRRAAAEALAKQPAGVAADMITPLLADQDPETRIAAARTMLILMQTNRPSEGFEHFVNFESSNRSKTNEVVATPERLAAWNAALKKNESDPEPFQTVARILTGQGELENRALIAALEGVDSKSLDSLQRSGALRLLLARLSLSQARPVLETFTKDARLYALAARNSTVAPEETRNFLLDPARFRSVLEKVSGEELLLVLGDLVGAGAGGGWSMLSTRPDSLAIASEMVSSTNAAWRAASLHTLGLLKTDQYGPAFETGLADSNKWVRITAVQGFMSMKGGREELEQRIGRAVGDPDFDVARFAALALLEPEIREFAGMSYGVGMFRFESVYGGYSQVSISGDRPLTVLESKPDYLRSARRWMNATNAEEGAVFALLLAQHGEPDGVKWLVDGVQPAAEQDGDDDAVLAAIALSGNTEYLPVVRRMMESRTQEYQLRELLKVVKGMTGAEVRQLRLEINRRIRLSAGSTGAVFD